VRQASLDLEFSDVRAPVDGRIGDRRVSPATCHGGSGGNTTLLATIVSLDPIRFEFTFDEASYLRYERMSKEGKDVTSREGSVLVALKLSMRRIRAPRRMDLSTTYRPFLRHNPRPRRLFKFVRRLTPECSARPGARLACLLRTSGAGGCDRHRAGA